MSGYIHWPGVWMGAAPTLNVAADARALADLVLRVPDLPEGLEARVFRDGYVAMDFSSWPLSEGEPTQLADDDMPRRLLDRTRVLNAHLACLYTALAVRQQQHLQKMALSPTDLISSLSFDVHHFAGSNRFGFELLGARHPSGYHPDLPPLFDWRVGMRGPAVLMETLEESFRLFREIASRRELLTTVELELRAAKAVEDHDYANGCLFAWTICERLLMQMWRDYIDANRRRTEVGRETGFISATRRETLRDSRSFTASVVAETMSLIGLLPADLYDRLTLTRKARNGWVHELRPVSHETAITAVQAALDLFEKVSGIRLNLPIALHFSW